MPKENVVFLYGQMVRPPKIYINNTEGTPVRATFVLKVLRRPMPGERSYGGKLYFDCPVISTKNPQMIAQAAKYKENDMVEVKGVLSTKEVNKTSICPQCQEKIGKPGVIVYVTPIYLGRREEGISPEAGLTLLKERSEISNLIMAIGTLCRDPEFHTNEAGGRFAQYQLAINRKYRIREDDPDKKTDYPYVKTFGEQALKDSNGLTTGSIVYISGGLQTRSVVRTETCDACHNPYKWEEAVTEIVPYSTEYLANCILPEEEEERVSAQKKIKAQNDDDGEGSDD